MTLQLRYYQQEAIQRVLTSLSTDATTNPCVCIPTGGGKTPVIANLCKVFSENHYRTLVLAHRKELLEQSRDKILTWAPDVNVSVVSAGLGEHDFDGDVVVAGIQSVYKHGNKLCATGKIDFIIIDEAHLVPPLEENEGGMYNTLLSSLKMNNPNVNVIGLTATPYRLSSGLVYGEDRLFTKLIYDVPIPELIQNKYLTPLISKSPVDSNQTFHVKHGEFDAQEVNDTFNTKDVVTEACNNIVRLTKNRKSILIFCCSIDHCNAVADMMHRLTNEECAVITSKTRADNRESFLRRFKGNFNTSDLLGNQEKPLRFICNVDVLTTGFDAPCVDAVVLLRPTLSPGLFYQMCGRGFRLADGKENCMILDFAGNLRRHGYIDQLRIPDSTKKREKAEEDALRRCPFCFSMIDKEARICPDCGNTIKHDDFLCPNCQNTCDRRANFCPECGFKLRERNPQHEGLADFEHGILSTDDSNPVITDDVVSVQYLTHRAKSGVDCLKVDYKTNLTSVSEFICFDHTGFARKKACDWWKKRSAITPAPVSTAQAVAIIENDGIGEPVKVQYLPATPGNRYPKLVKADIGLERKIYSKEYSHTDNPFGLRCEECGCESFIYEQDSGIHTIRCAKCGACAAEVHSDDEDYSEFITEKRRNRVKFAHSFTDEFDADEYEPIPDFQPPEEEDIPF